MRNYENKTISCVQNVTWKYCREKFRFLGQLNGDILGIKNNFGLMGSRLNGWNLWYIINFSTF